MRRYRSILLYTLLPILVALPLCFYFMDRGEGEGSASDVIWSEGYENSTARQEWMLRRLRDPATGRIPDDIRQMEMAYASTLPRRDQAFYRNAGSLDYVWMPRGPYNVGGRTRAFALDVRGEDTMLAGGVSGGMWRSTDHGATWSKTSLPAQLPSVTCIAQDTRPGKENTWYYGSGEMLGSSASENGAYYGGDGIFKSTDNGRSWSPLARTSSGTPHKFDLLYDFVWKIAIDPSNLEQDELYAAVYGGIVRSTNGGENWSTVIVDNNRYSSATDLAVTSNGVVYATLNSEGGRRGIWRSENGTQWTNIMPPNWPGNYQRIVVGIAPSNNNVLYFLAETPGRGHPGLNFKGDTNWASLWKYTYLSGDGSGAGGVWEDRSANLPSYGGSFGDFNPQSSYNLHLNIRPDNENIVYIGGTNLYRSTDGFATAGNSAWIGGYRNVQLDSSVRLELHYPNHHPDQHGMLFSRSNPDIIYTMSDGGLHKTLDGMAPTVTWQELNNGYYTSQFYTVAIDHATPGDYTIVGGLQDNGTWSSNVNNATTPWNWLGSGDGSFCAVADGKTSIYVSKQEGKAYRVILDGNGQMTASTRIDPLGGGRYLFINPFALDPGNTNSMFLSAGSDLWRNSDLTQIPLNSTSRATTNWTRLANAATPDSVRISAIGISKESPAHRVYYGTETGRVFRLDNAHEGDPASVEVTAGPFPDGANVACIAVDPLDGDRAVVVFSNYSVQSLFLTTDAGETWKPISGNLEQLPSGAGAGPSCRWFAFLHRPGGSIFFVGTSTGLYSTRRLDTMATKWVLEGAETIGNVVVDMVQVRQSDGYVVIGTHGNGVYSTIVGTIGVDDAGAGATAGLELAQNYPNPVRGATTIRFTIPEGRRATPVRLTLHDLRGREVMTMLDRTLSPGEYNETVDLRSLPASDLPNGAYYYRLRAGENVVTKGMQVVR